MGMLRAASALALLEGAARWIPSPSQPGEAARQARFPLQNPYATLADHLIEPVPELAGVGRIQLGRQPLCSIPRPSASLRVVVVGGSAIYGYPLTELMALPHHLERQLGQRLPPGWSAEVINLGQPGMDLEQEVQVVQQALASLHPDIVVVWSGNNEFNRLRTHKATFGRFDARAERLRTLLLSSALYRLLATRLSAERSLQPIGAAAAPTASSWASFRRSVVDDNDRMLVGSLYEAHLERICRLAQAAGTHLVLGAVPVNLDWSSEHTCDGLGADPAWEPTVQAAATHADQLAREGHPAEALASLEPHRMGASRAWVELRRGQLLRVLQQPEAALQALQLAAELDPHPVRALPSWGSRVESVARRFSVAFVDGIEACAARSSDHITDGRQLVDACHYRGSTARWLARAIAERIQEAGWLALPALASTGPSSPQASRARGEPTPPSAGTSSSLPIRWDSPLPLYLEDWPGLEEALETYPPSTSLPLETLRSISSHLDFTTRQARWNELLEPTARATMPATQSPHSGAAPHAAWTGSLEALVVAGHDLYACQRYSAAEELYLEAAHRLDREAAHRLDRARIRAALMVNAGHAAWSAGHWVNAQACYNAAWEGGNHDPLLARRLSMLSGLREAPQVTR